MPFIRIEMRAGKPASYRELLGQAVQDALHAALGVPPEERFQVITEHGCGALVIDAAYLGIARSPDAIIVQVVLNEGRSEALKSAFYTTLADVLHERLGLRREDLVINLVEVKRNNWSFGNGKAQLIGAG